MGPDMMSNLQHYYDIVITLARKDFKLRYRNSVLGFVWSLLNPLAYMLILTAVFSYLLRSNIPNYPSWLLLALLVWRFFSVGTSSSLYSIVGNPSFITKVRVPRFLIVLSANVASTYGAILEFVALFPVLILLGIRITFLGLLLPVLIAMEFVLIFGVSLGLAALNTKYRDFNQLWDITLQLGFFLCPIVYDASLIPERYRFVYFLNPMTRLIDSVRDIFLFGFTPSLTDYMVVIAASAILLLIGGAIFRSFERSFAEEL
jgi:ABC-type polysaccharide/polyol phosphate export permease